MIEDLALGYSELSSGWVRTIGYITVALGGLLGGMTNTDQGRIHRAPYFALLGLIFLCTSVAIAVGLLFIVPALAGGFFFVIVAIELAATFAGGFFIARLAMARSRAITGDTGHAVLAFIPFANLWLMFKPSADDTAGDRPTHGQDLAGGAGVTVGLVAFLVGVGLLNWSQASGLRRVETAAASGRFTEALLDRILVELAANTVTPTTVDEATVLVRMEAQGNVLSYFYEVSTDIVQLPPTLAIGPDHSNCTLETTTPYLDAGAILRHVYRHPDGTEVGIVEISRESCGR